MSNFDIGSLSSSQNYSGLIGGGNRFDLYNFSVKESGSFSLSLNGLSDNADVQLLNSSGEVLYSSAALGISAEAIALNNLAAGNYAVRVLQVGGSTNYNLNLAANPQVEPLTGMDLISGYFTVGESGQVGVDPLFDGGWYKGELAVFSLEGMEKYVPGSEEFIKEAVVRSLSNSEQGYVVFSDASEDAKFSGGLGEGNYNDGKYFGEKTFAMKPGDKFGFMLIPNGKVQDVLNNPAIGADKRPLFSLVIANPNQGFHIGQIADINGQGNTFSIEDQRVDTGSDKDYNDLIFQVSGATGKAIKIDEVINQTKDWRNSEKGKQLLDDIKPEQSVEGIPIIETIPVVETQPIVETIPVVETQPVYKTKPLQNSTGIFTVGNDGKVSVDFLFDGGAYQGEVAIVSLAGMEDLEPGSAAFIQEAAKRANSNFEMGYVVIRDRIEGAKFNGILGEPSQNSGEYQGSKTFTMRPGDKFAIMLVPNGTVQQVAENPIIGGDKRPLFSIPAANPDGKEQVKDLNGNSRIFAWEDIAGNWSDRDFNDFIIKIDGATGNVPQIGQTNWLNS
jgi:hypothetical protein